MSWASDFLAKMYTAWYGNGTRVDAPPATGIQDKPGIRWYPPRGFSATQDGAYSIMSLHGDQPITQPASVRLNFTTPPASYGFDVDWTQAGVAKHVAIRHVPVAGDTQLNALKDMLDQFQCNADIVALFASYPDGADILSYAYVRREPAAGEPHRLTFFGHNQLVPDTHFRIHATAGVLVEGVDGNGQMSPLAEVAPFFHISRSWFDAGQHIPAGSLIGGITFGVDCEANPSIPTPWRKNDTRNADAMQATIMARILDPVTGAAELIFTADKFTFQDKSGNHCSFKCVGSTFVPC